MSGRSLTPIACKIRLRTTVPSFRSLCGSAWVAGNGILRLGRWSGVFQQQQSGVHSHVAMRPPSQALAGHRLRPVRHATCARSQHGRVLVVRDPIANGRRKLEADCRRLALSRIHQCPCIVLHSALSTSSSGGAGSRRLELESAWPLGLSLREWRSRCCLVSNRTTLGRSCSGRSCLGL